MASTVSSTTLSFGLVSCPVALKKVTDKKTAGFKSCSPEGNPVRQMYRDEVTGELFEPSALEKAVEVGDGLVMVGKETVKAIDESVKIDGLSVEKFIPLAEVPFARAEAAYYIAPVKTAGLAERKPLALLRDGLKASGKAGIGKLTLRTKQRAFVVYERDGGLMVNTLVFADEFANAAEAAEVLEGAPPTDEKTLNLFETLLATMEGEASDLDVYVDESVELKSALVAKAAAGEKIDAPVAATETAAPADNIEDLLLASIGQTAPEPKAKAKPKPKAKAAA
jgi:DNA end-binding protein Ku